MGKINYKSIYDVNRKGWLAMTENPGKYEALLAGHYSDSNHFVYELLQNAEDENASTVVFEYSRDSITFYHDGAPFDEDDVRGVSSMLETTKADDAKTIGKFGMGFKSVFKYTCTPEIYTDEEAFRIESYLLPVELDDANWDYRYQMRQGVSYTLNGSQQYIPFEKSSHLTKVVLPFQKREKNGEIRKISGADIVDKLKSLEPEILLFLSSIKNLFWVDLSSYRYEKFTLITSEEDDKFRLCHLEGNAVSENSKRYSDTYYLKYQKYISLPEMGKAEVSLAFKTNAQKKSIQKVDNPNIWVYFPTKDQTNLPCLMHGSYETAVSREKLMRPSTFNNALYKETRGLFVEAVRDFKSRNLISQTFIRQIIISAFADETLSGVKYELTELFKKEAMIPDRDGKLHLPEDMFVSVPFDMIELRDKKPFGRSFPVDKAFCLLNDERAAGFAEYYTWLKEDLNVTIFGINKWAENLNQLCYKDVITPDIQVLEPLYDYLDKYSLKNYDIDKKLKRKKNTYEADVEQYTIKAWKILKTIPILINGEGELVAACNEDGSTRIYLSSTSEYRTIAKSAIVLSTITQNFKSLLEENFGLKEFDNFEYVKNKVLVKYYDHPRQIEITEKFINDYADDILQICKLASNVSYASEISELIENRCIVLVKSKDKHELVAAKDAYRTNSIEGASMKDYYSGLGRELHYIDEAFYKEHGISMTSLFSLGIHLTPVIEGPREGQGLKAIGEFRPFFEIAFLNRNIKYIQENEDTELAKKKSSAILKIIVENADKMAGRVVRSATNEYEEGICSALKTLRNEDWLFANGVLASIEEISKNELDKDVYFDLSKYYDSCRILGFTMDASENAFDAVLNLNQKDKKNLLKELAKELGIDLSSGMSTNGETVFDPLTMEQDEFPLRNIKNRLRLVNYIQNQFFATDPTRYKEVIIRKKANDSTAMRKAYVSGMYTNQFGNIICQCCRSIMTLPQVYAVEIANFELPMEQITLCLCPNCYQKYEPIKKTKKDMFKASIKRAIMDVDLNQNKEYYKIYANEKTPLYFTQTHIAELQEIFKLLDTYGLPSAGPKVIGEGGITGGKLDQVSVCDGDFITYETMDDRKPHSVEINEDKYSLHKAMIGRTIGVTFEYEGRQYRILKKT